MIFNKIQFAFILFANESSIESVNNVIKVKKAILSFLHCFQRTE